MKAQRVSKHGACMIPVELYNAVSDSAKGVCAPYVHSRHLRLGCNHSAGMHMKRQFQSIKERIV